VDLDPNLQMNVWLSSASNHQWNPNQKTPATAWEAEIDRLMQAQASESNPAGGSGTSTVCKRSPGSNRHFLYLMNKNTLIAVSPSLHNVKAALIRPYAYWNVETFRFRLRWRAAAVTGHGNDAHVLPQPPLLFSTSTQ
jgi:peptide/nickel transport system substrate-binding protein